MVLRRVSRFAASPLLLLCAVCLSQTPAQTASPTAEPASSNLPRSFHDPLLNITYFYPGRFTAVPTEQPAAEQNPAQQSPAAAQNPAQCVQSDLSGSSTSPVGNSVFVLSTIGNTCPGVLQGASDLGPFTREQILRQLKRYGTPAITQEPSHYVIDGHPAAITLATVQQPASTNPNSIIPARTTYAAKACWLGNIPVKPRKKSEPVDPIKHVLCFDFTTQDRDLLSLLFAFSLQFDNHGPQPLVPGSALR